MVLPSACHSCRNEESRLMLLTSARTSGADERVQMPCACCWSSPPADVCRCVVSLLRTHVHPPSASPRPARAPRLRQPLLPPDPLLSVRARPGARMRTSMLRPQDPMRAVVHPIYRPWLSAPGPCPHGSLNISLKHETLAM
jgi:hypothetical protein